MTLSKLTAFSCEQGDAKLREDEIQFQSADNDWGSDKMKISKPEPCKRSFFVSLPLDFIPSFVLQTENKQSFVSVENLGSRLPKGHFLKRAQAA